jgi:hypothetical protein
MSRMSAVPPNRPDGPARVGGEGNGSASQGAILHAWLYDVDEDGKSRPMWATGGRPMEKVHAGAILQVSVEGGQSTQTERYLKAPRAEGMASQPVTVGLDPRTGYWTIRNSGRTNTLRVQQYGLAAVPLRPGAAMPMGGEDVAVWIPVVPREPRGSHKTEAFRLLILAAKEPSREEPFREPAVRTRLITAARIPMTAAKQEALIAYFGPHLSWPPLPAPHVRQEQEVEVMADAHRLAKQPNSANWARNRKDVLTGRDGMFTTADWYPRLGGGERTLPNHLAAFYRLVELGTVTLPRVRRWATAQNVEPYVIIDSHLGFTA